MTAYFNTLDVEIANAYMKKGVSFKCIVGVVPLREIIRFIVDLVDPHVLSGGSILEEI